MNCTHSDRPNCLSLPSFGNPFMCIECWEKDVQPFLELLSKEPSKGNLYEYHGPEIMGSDGKYYREMRLK